jgi:hypothetical protein
MDLDSDYFEGGTDEDGLVTPDQGARRANLRKFDSQHKLMIDTLSQGPPRIKFEEMNDLDKYK